MPSHASTSDDTETHSVLPRPYPPTRHKTFNPDKPYPFPFAKFPPKLRTTTWGIAIEQSDLPVGFKPDNKETTAVEGKWFGKKRQHYVLFHAYTMDRDLRFKTIDDQFRRAYFRLPLVLKGDISWISRAWLTFKSVGLLGAPVVLATSYVSFTNPVTSWTSYSLEKLIARSQSADLGEVEPMQVSVVSTPRLRWTLRLGTIKPVKGKPPHTRFCLETWRELPRPSQELAAVDEASLALPRLPPAPRSDKIRRTGEFAEADPTQSGEIVPPEVE